MLTILHGQVMELIQSVDHNKLKYSLLDMVRKATYEQLESLLPDLMDLAPPGESEGGYWQVQRMDGSGEDWADISYGSKKFFHVYAKDIKLIKEKDSGRDYYEKGCFFDYLRRINSNDGIYCPFPTMYVGEETNVNAITTDGTFFIRFDWVPQQLSFWDQLKIDKSKKSTKEIDLSSRYTQSWTPFICKDNSK